jgi:hypothetical protein
MNSIFKKNLYDLLFSYESETIQILACDNYDGFQHLSFHIFQKKNGFMKLTPGEVVVFPMVPAYVKSDCYIPSDFSLVFLQDFFLYINYRNVEF